MAKLVNYFRNLLIEIINIVFICKQKYLFPILLYFRRNMPILIKYYRAFLRCENLNKYLFINLTGIFEFVLPESPVFKGR